MMCQQGLSLQKVMRFYPKSQDYTDLPIRIVLVGELSRTANV